MAVLLVQTKTVRGKPGELRAAIPGFENMDEPSKTVVLTGLVHFIREFFDDDAVIYDVTDDKSVPKLVELPRGIQQPKGSS